MAPQQQDPAQTTNLTASEAEPAQTRQSNANLFKLGVFDDDTCLLQDEFRRFLEKSGFVEEVIDFYINKERQLAENASGTDSTHDSDRLNTGEWEQLVRTRLPYWLFRLIYKLTAQARLVKRLDDHVELAVTDSEIGIEPEFLPFVFDRFTQANNVGNKHAGPWGSQSFDSSWSCMAAA